MTTLSLLLAALANRLDDLPQGKQEIIEGFSPRKLRNYYLLNPEEDGERHYKLILSKTDKESLIAVIDNKEMPKDAFIKIVRFIEAYVFRRAICAIPTNSLNKTFATFMKSVDKNNYLESVMAQFMLLPSYRRFPSDGEFIKEFRTRDLYNIPRRSYWLRRLENYNRKERVEIDQYTIEHIMPQNPNLSEEWKRELGADWERIQESWLHTLGNLTLTGYNSEYSDRPFVEKRDMENGFKDRIS